MIVEREEISCVQANTSLRHPTPDCAYKMPCPLENAATDSRVLTAIALLNQGRSDIEILHVFEFDVSNPKANSARVAEVGKILQSLDAVTNPTTASSNQDADVLILNDTKKLYEAAWKAVLLPQAAEENLYSLNKNVDGSVLDFAGCLALFARSVQFLENPNYWFGLASNCVTDLCVCQICNFGSCPRTSCLSIIASIESNNFSKLGQRHVCS